LFLSFHALSFSFSISYGTPPPHDTKGAYFLKFTPLEFNLRH
jgi:hypothetical protein